jgi:hypothetical protein
MSNSDFPDLKSIEICVTILSRGAKMKPTELLKYLIERLKENGIIRYNKDFWEYIGLDTNQKQTKKLSDYLRRSGTIRDKVFLKKIEKKFGFEKNIWNICESSQIARIDEAIERALALQKLPGKSALDISDIIQDIPALSQTQQSLLKDFETLQDKKEIEACIDTYLSEGLLDKKVQNQEFLVHLLYLAYDKGLYSIIIAFILPNLYMSYRQRTEVQKIEAHTLGSLNEYKEAKHILHKLIHHNTIENINLRTSALSNHKRELFASTKPIPNEELYLLVQGYQELHAMERIYSYYTGINLLYMVVLGERLFPNDTRFSAIDKKEIYDQSKPSLKKDKTHNDYYVSMSELEFHLLLEREGVWKKIESFLINDKPHPSLVERTLRQMKLFTNHIGKNQHTLLSLFQKTIVTLEDYITSRITS